MKEFKGTESTKKSIQKIRKSEEKNGQDIVLAISYKGLKFLSQDAQVRNEYQEKKRNFLSVTF